MKKLFAVLLMASGVCLGQSGPSYDNAPAEVGLVSITGSFPFAAMSTTGSSGPAYDNAPGLLLLGRNANGKYYVCGTANPCTSGDGTPSGAVSGDLSGTLPSPTVTTSHITSGGAGFTAPVTITNTATTGQSLFLNTSSIFGSAVAPVLLQGNAVSGPAFGFTNTTYGTDNKTWDIYENPTSFDFRTSNDANSSNVTWLSAVRSGNTIAQINSNSGSGSWVHTGTFSASKYSTATNCVNAASPAVCGAAPAGKVQIAAGATTLTINTTAITALSGCWFTYNTEGITAPTNMASLLPPFIGARIAGTSITVTLPVAPATNAVNMQFGCIN